jgi:hypothetical protein
MNAPAYLSYYVLTCAVAIIAVIIYGLRRGFDRADSAPSARDVTLRAFAIVLVGWFAASVVLAWMGAYVTAATSIPTIQYGILIPIIIGGWQIWRSPRLTWIIDAVPQSWLVGVQLYRALGMIFLILYATGWLPGLFAWPAGLGDVLVGVLAPVVALAYARAPRQNADLVYVWNIFGIADLVIAVTTGFLTSPSPLQRFAFDRPNELITAFPLVLIPVFLVPLAVLFHFASLVKLRHDRRMTGLH